MGKAQTGSRSLILFQFARRELRSVGLGVPRTAVDRKSISRVEGYVGTQKEDGPHASIRNEGVAKSTIENIDFMSYGRDRSRPCNIAGCWRTHGDYPRKMRLGRCGW